MRDEKISALNRALLACLPGWGSWLIDRVLYGGWVEWWERIHRTPEEIEIDNVVEEIELKWFMGDGSDWSWLVDDVVED